MVKSTKGGGVRPKRGVIRSDPQGGRGGWGWLGVVRAGEGVGMLRGIPYLKIEKFVGFTKSPFHFLIDMKFISKILEILFMQFVSSPDPDLRKL